MSHGFLLENVIQKKKRRYERPITPLICERWNKCAWHWTRSETLILLLFLSYLNNHLFVSLPYFLSQLCFVAFLVFLALNFSVLFLSICLFMSLFCFRPSLSLYRYLFRLAVFYLHLPYNVCFWPLANFSV